MPKFRDIIGGDQPVLVDFFSSYKPTLAFNTILEELKREVGNRVRIIKVDVDINKAAAFTYGVRGVPTTILFKNGQIKWKKSGILTKNALYDIINQYA